MVVKVNDTLKVIEAIGDKVQGNFLKKFFARSVDTTVIQTITVGKVKHQFENLIPNAISSAQQLIGQPFDDKSLLSNSKWHCSELIYKPFKQVNNQNDFFELTPITFINPKTKTFSLLG